ncbi:MAG: CarD family transcriptional regulator [Sphingobacteriia bacterium]|nr:CarD family transcriptional regulator [Sphingobacteriia bacterium]
MAIAFNINDMVVYPAHGVGQVIARETQKIGGIELDVFVVFFGKEKMTLRVPVNRAIACGLRPIANTEEMNKVISIIQSKPKSNRGMWSRRAKEYDTKINSGNLIDIAEVLRDLHKNVTDNPDCSYSERTVFELALQRLAAEYAAIKSLAVQEAMEEILSILRERIYA